MCQLVAASVTVEMRGDRVALGEVWHIVDRIANGANLQPAKGRASRTGECGGDMTEFRTYLGSVRSVNRFLAKLEDRLAPDGTFQFRPLNGGRLK